MRPSFARALLVSTTFALAALGTGACQSDEANVAGPGGDTGNAGDTGSAGDGGAENGGSSSGGKGGSSNGGKGGSSGKGGAAGAGNGGSTSGGEGGTGLGGAGASGKGGAAGTSGASGKGGAGGSGGTGGKGGTAGASGTGGSSGKGGTAGASGTGGKGGSGTGGAPPTSEICSDGNPAIRLMAANLTTGNNQSYEGPGIRILQAIKPDVILIQEFKLFPKAPVDKLVADICGADCVFHQGGGNIPNGIVSRFPILESGTWADSHVADREFEWARIDLPGPRNLLAVSVHLLTNDSTRQLETVDLAAYIKANAQPDELVVLGGDFNTSSYSDGVFTTLAGVLSVSAPYPADQSGNTGTNTNRLMDGKAKPYDHVVANALLRNYEVPVFIGKNFFFSGLVVDTRVYNPIADLAPALTDDSGAPNMQHMGVVRAYCVPGE